MELKAAFPAGTPLYSLRHSPADALPLFVEILLYAFSLGTLRLAGIGRPHGFVSPEAGILVWQAPGGWQRLTAGELLGSWVPLREWQAFAALLERHELRIRSERAGRRNDPAAAAETAAREAALAELAAERVALAGLQRERLTLLQELENAQSAPAATPTTPPAPADGGEEELEELLDEPAPTTAELAAYAQAGGGEVVSELDRALTELAGRDAPLPVDDLLLVRAHATILEDFAAALATFDERLAATLADPSLDEEEREERLQKWCTMRGQLLDRI